MSTVVWGQAPPVSCCSCLFVALSLWSQNCTASQRDMWMVKPTWGGVPFTWKEEQTLPVSF